MHKHHVWHLRANKKAFEENKVRRDIGQVPHLRQQEAREPVHRCAVWFSEDTDILLNVDASGQAEEFQSTPACQLLLWFCDWEKCTVKKLRILFI